VRHQTDKQSFLLRTDAGVVSEGEALTLVYTIEAGIGATLFVESETGTLTEIGMIDADLSLAGNDQPWILAASQYSSRTDDGDRLLSHFDGAIKDFEILSLDEFVF